MWTRIVKVSGFILGFIALILFAFFANEAHKEVYFLCGNFKAGHAYANVTRQLKTASLSTYTVENLETGKRIVHSSVFHLHRFRCHITFNDNDSVTSVSYN